MIDPHRWIERVSRPPCSCSCSWSCSTVTNRRAPSAHRLAPPASKREPVSQSVSQSVTLLEPVARGCVGAHKYMDR
jgi:hypothetical protein